MNRVKRHKIKTEKSASATSQLRELEEHDLAHYIHDRVELMHQVFSILKYKELKSMAPECVRNLAIGDLEELCTEELLGISSKRLLAILDGAEPPSDTESSSPSPTPDLETISLDSISSDEELLVKNSSKKKKHKHRHHDSKSKSKKKGKKSHESKPEENAEVSKASRAGLTVLELLELQARARAIRAQLQQEQANKGVSETMVAVESSLHSSDNEVEIKEEPPDVVEISSEDEKPDVTHLKEKIAEKLPIPEPADKQTVNEPESQKNQVITKHVNDLIITVPQTKSTRKIKLNRNKVTASVSNITQSNGNVATSEICNVTAVIEKIVPEKSTDMSKSSLEKPKETKVKKRKKEKKKKNVEKDGSDHDEIMLQLSDSEKMDLFEALDESGKNYDKVSSSSEDSESSSSESEKDSSEYTSTKPNLGLVASEAFLSKSSDKINPNKNDHNAGNIETDNMKINDENISNKTEQRHSSEKGDNNKNKQTVVAQNIDSTAFNITIPDTTGLDIAQTISANQHTVPKNETIDSGIENNTIRETTIVVTPDDSRYVTVIENNKANFTAVKDILLTKDAENLLEVNSIEDIPMSDNATSDIDKSQKIGDKNQSQEKDKKLSDGELSDCESSEVEAVDVQTEVVCISDEENLSKKSNKKKTKKDKKSKKQKKSKKSISDVHENADQNIYKDSGENMNDVNRIASSSTNETKSFNNDETIELYNDDVYEILELSDDSSCYEVNGTVLSKEPTAEEIEALSAKIDEIEREEIVTDEQIEEHERMIAEKELKKQNDENAENISWKDRYLDSKKVKRVLTTANIFNALRKKNKELKKKIEESKKKEEVEENVENVAEYNNIQLEEGSIKQYNALQGSTKYVDPVTEPTEAKEDAEKVGEKTEQQVTSAIEVDNLNKEMKKDAKQLLKMYKKLLKYNDMNKKKDPNKKKKKKHKKKDKPDGGNNSATAETTNII